MSTRRVYIIAVELRRRQAAPLIQRAHSSHGDGFQVTNPLVVPVLNLVGSPPIPMFFLYYFFVPAAAGIAPVVREKATPRPSGAARSFGKGQGIVPNLDSSCLGYILGRSWIPEAPTTTSNSSSSGGPAASEFNRRGILLVLSLRTFLVDINLLVPHWNTTAVRYG